MQLSDIVKEQYYLSRHSHIGLDVSNNLPIFEHDAYVNLLLEEFKKREEARRKEPV